MTRLGEKGKSVAKLQLTPGQALTHLQQLLRGKQPPAAAAERANSAGRRKQQLSRCDGLQTVSRSDPDSAKSNLQQKKGLWAAAASRLPLRACGTCLL